MYALGKYTYRHQFIPGFITGIVSYLGLIYWVVVAMNRYGGIDIFTSSLILLMFVLYLSIYSGIFSTAVSMMDTRLSVPAYLSAPIVWVLLEYLRGIALTGFPCATCPTRTTSPSSSYPTPSTTRCKAAIWSTTSTTRPSGFATIAPRTTSSPSSTTATSFETGGSDYQWSVADAAMTRLETEEAELPDGMTYGVCVGNHDESPNGVAGSTEKFNLKLRVERFQDRPYYGGNYNGTNDDNWFTFSAGTLDFVVVDHRLIHSRRKNRGRRSNLRRRYKQMRCKIISS